MKLLSFNIQSLRDLEYADGKFKGPFPDLTFNARWPKMKTFFSKLLAEESVEIFALQEVGEEAVKSISDYFSSIGYQFHVSKYCPDALAQQFIFAFNPKNYELISLEQLPYTKTGKFLSDEERRTWDKKTKEEHNLGVEYEKSAQVILLRDLATNSLIKVYNTHPGLINQHRLACMDILAAKVKEDLASGLNVVVNGDMNQFDASEAKPKVLMEQPQKLEKAGLTWMRKYIATEGAQSTFMAYAYDIMRFLTQNERQEIFKMMDSAKELKNNIVAKKEDPSTNEELSASYKNIRNFFQEKQKELVTQHPGEGAGLSVDLDFVGVSGPIFGKAPEEGYTVKPITYFHGRLFNTAQEVKSRVEFEKELITEADADPLVSDHIALLLAPSK